MAYVTDNNGSMVTSRSTIVTVRIATYENRVMTGSIHNDFYDKTILFYDSLEFFNVLESLFDSLSFPSRFEDYRRFQPPVVKRSRKTSKERAVDTMSEKSADSKATFVLHVQFRQNATWQGTIQWVDENKQQSFRSTLEMIRLIDEAMDKTSGEKRISWEDC